MQETERYHLMDFAQVLKLGLIEERERRHHEYSSFIVDTQGNVLIGMDGGEPEDQILYRDWKWVVPALNRAYIEGKKARTKASP